MRIPPAAFRVLRATFLGLLAGCVDGPDPAGLIESGPPTQLIVLAGDSQSAPVGTELPDPIVVKVLDDRDKPVSGQIVNFRVTDGGGSVFAGAAITNRQGEARERWTLGTSTSGQQRLEARAVDPSTGAPLTFAAFTATAVPGPATDARFDSLPNLFLVNSTIAPVRVELFDAYGNATTNASTSLAIQITPGTGTPGATLSGTTTRSAVAGVATFDDLSIDKGGAGYTLTAVAPGVSSGTSVFFTILAPTRVEVQPISFGVMLGDTVTLKAIAFDANNVGYPGLPVTWQSVSPTASISAANLLTGLNEGYMPLKATIGGVTGPSGGGVSVYATLDSVSFTFGNPKVGWTDNSQSLGSTRCVSLYSFGPPGLTNPARWHAGTSNAAVIQVIPGADLSKLHCFRAVGAGTATVTGSFGGQVASKVLTVP